MTSKIASARVVGHAKEGVLAAVERAMELADWQEYIKGKKIFLKPNCVSYRVIPGQCTSPWVVEGVVKVLSENTGAKLYLGDSDVSSACQFDRMVQNWGYEGLCGEYGVEIVNLSRQETTAVDAGGTILQRVDIPTILLDVDCIVTLPVLKTHALTGMTGALKNQWGCLTRVRHQYHAHADRCIAELNRLLSVSFVVADATVCMEGQGPCTGLPKVMDYVFASHDRVATDSLACDMMGIDRQDVRQLALAKEAGVGTDAYAVVGDKVIPERFIPAERTKNPITTVEMFLRRVPIISFLAFRTPYFRVSAWLAAHYYNTWRYHIGGKRYARRIVRKHPLYAKEFGHLIR